MNKKEIYENILNEGEVETLLAMYKYSKAHHNLGDIRLVSESAPTLRMLKRMTDASSTSVVSYRLMKLTGYGYVIHSQILREALDIYFDRQYDLALQVGGYYLTEEGYRVAERLANEQN